MSHMGRGTKYQRKHVREVQAGQEGETCLAAELCPLAMHKEGPFSYPCVSDIRQEVARHRAVVLWDVLNFSAAALNESSAVGHAGRMFMH